MAKYNELIEIKGMEETQSVSEPTNEFGGYTLEELRYQRALVALRKDFCATKITKNVEQIRGRNIFGGSGSKIRGPQIGGLVSKMISGLGYLDYAMIGMSLFGTGKKIFQFFKGRRSSKN